MKKSRNFNYFLIFLLLSPLLWLGSNILEERLKDFFYWLELAENPHLMASQERQLSFQNRLRELKPVRIKNVPDLEISAKSAISVLVDKQGKERILFEKEKDIKLPIASLTKLITAKIVIDNYDLSKKIKISEEAVNQEENFGKLSAGKILSVKYLLYPLLMESSNDAAYALSNDYDGMTEEKFLQLMNEKSINFGLQNTYFANSTGLDPEKPEEPKNYSTAFDLAKLAENLLEDKLLWEILAVPSFNSYGPELSNTNALLGKLPRIVGGKTGYTEEALGCFLLVIEAPRGKGYIISVILGSSDRFGEMEKLAAWLYQAYKW